jgi:hypothetical protein
MVDSDGEGDGGIAVFQEPAELGGTQRRIIQFTGTGFIFCRMPQHPWRIIIDGKSHGA